MLAFIPAPPTNELLLVGFSLVERTLGALDGGVRGAEKVLVYLQFRG
jgi:hypothetical protein